MKRNINKFLILFTAVFALLMASCAPAKLTSYTMKLGYFPEDSDGLEAVAYTCTLEKDMYIFQEALSLGKVSSGAFIEAEIGALEAHPYILVILQNSSGTKRFSSDVWDLSKIKGNELHCEYWNRLNGSSPDGTYGINGVMINNLTKDAMNRTLTFDFSLQPYYVFKVSKEVSSSFLYEIYTSSEYVFAIGSENFDDIERYNKEKLLKYINVNPSFGYEDVSYGYVSYNTSKNVIENFSDYYILVFATQFTEDTAFSICLTDTKWLDELSENYKIAEYSRDSWDSIKSADAGGKIYFASANTDTVLRSYNPEEKEMRIEKIFKEKIMSVVSYGKEVFVSTYEQIKISIFDYKNINRIYSFNTISGECHLLHEENCENSIELFVSGCNLVYFAGKEKNSSDVDYYLKSINLAALNNHSEINVLKQSSGIRVPKILFVEEGKVYYAAIDKETVGSVEINADGTFGAVSENPGYKSFFRIYKPVLKNGHDIICSTSDGPMLYKENAGKYDRTTASFDVELYKTVTEFDGKIFSIKNKDYTIKDKNNKEYKIKVNGYDDKKNTVQQMSLGIFDAATYQNDTKTMKKGYFADVLGMAYNEDAGSLETLTYGMGFAVQGDTLYLVAMDVPVILHGDNFVSFIPVWSKASDWNTTLEGVTANILGFNDNTNMKFDSSFMIIEN